MKRALTIVLALGFGAAAFGDEAKPAAQQQPQQDSPMVAAAKRANRKGRKPTNVITNETLSKSGANAHVTTTATQKPFVPPKPYVAPRPTPEMIAQQARDAEKRRTAADIAAQAKAEEQRKQAAEAAAAASEEGVYDDEEVDPNQKPPQR